MRELHRVLLVTDTFDLLSPAQQLLDRLLIGFPRRGVFERPRLGVTLFLANKPGAPLGELVDQRRRDLGLTIVESLETARADAVILAGSTAALAPPDALVRHTLRSITPETPIFLYGMLAETKAKAMELAEMARSRQLPLCSGTAIPGTIRLPDVDVPAGTRLREGLIVAPGEFPAAEFNALEGLLPVLERRKAGERGVRRLRYLEGDAVWIAGTEGQWSWPLLASALSRSHTPQGNAVLDGRTEDLAGLGLVPKLARQPRAWLLEHEDGLRSALLVLNGVLADMNFAVRAGNQNIISAQLFRPPPPQQEEYSRLAGTVLDYFSTSLPPWAATRSMLEVALLSAMTSPGARSGAWVQPS